MTILSNGHQWKFSEFLDNNNYSFNKKKPVTKWEKDNTLDC